jgi:hypothetical protein
MTTQAPSQPFSVSPILVAVLVGGIALGFFIGQAAPGRGGVGPGSVSVAENVTPQLTWADDFATRHAGQLAVSPARSLTDGDDWALRHIAPTSIGLSDDYATRHSSSAGQ